MLRTTATSKNILVKFNEFYYEGERVMRTWVRIRVVTPTHAFRHSYLYSLLYHMRVVKSYFNKNRCSVPFYLSHPAAQIQA